MSRAPNEQEWAELRIFLLRDTEAFHRAFRFMSARYGPFFAITLMHHIRENDEKPVEGNFADLWYYKNPAVFSDAWKEREDFKGRPIGDQVDVTSDAVTDLWERYQMTRNLDEWKPVGVGK